MSQPENSNSNENSFRSIAFRGITKEILDELLEGCQVISYEYRYLYLNKAAIIHSHESRDKLIGRTMMKVYPGIENTKMFSVLKECMENRTPKQMENEFIYPDGTKGWFELRFEPVPEGIFILSIDVTERKEAIETLKNMEEQLRQSQKMEAIGRLAAGVAHDFNNLLTVINISGEIILKTLPKSNPVYKRIEQIRNAGDQAASLTGQLLAFSRQQVLEPKILDFNHIIDNLEVMLRRLIGEDIELVTMKTDDLGHIEADPGQMEQIIMNLAVNARDAMPDGGTLSIETSNVELDPHYSKTHFGIKPGRYVMVTISDTGFGMDKSVQSRIFEPFYTTKEEGKGSGLGLSTVFGIVKQSNGSIWVYSEPDKGTVFKIYLPIIDEKITTDQLITSGKSSLNGDETILLVEDKDDVREITAFTLRMFGYTILEAGNGNKAVKVFKNYKKRIHLLISDVIMPGMGGHKVAETIQDINPGIKVLYMSGYTDDTVVRQGIIHKEVAFIQKPFTPDSLGRKVRQVLDE